MAHEKKSFKAKRQTDGLLTACDSGTIHIFWISTSNPNTELFHFRLCLRSGSSDVCYKVVKLIDSLSDTRRLINKTECNKISFGQNNL